MGLCSASSFEKTVKSYFKLLFVTLYTHNFRIRSQVSRRETKD